MSPFRQREGKWWKIFFWRFNIRGLVYKFYYEIGFYNQSNNFSDSRFSLTRGSADVAVRERSTLSWWSVAPRPKKRQKSAPTRPSVNKIETGHKNETDNKISVDKIEARWKRLYENWLYISVIRKNCPASSDDSDQMRKKSQILWFQKLCKNYVSPNSHCIFFSREKFQLLKNKM